MRRQLPRINASSDKASGSSHTASWPGITTVLRIRLSETLAMTGIVDYATSLNLPIHPGVYLLHIDRYGDPDLWSAFFIPKYISQERTCCCAIIGLVSSFADCLTR